MSRDEIIAELKARQAEIRAKGVLHLALFGSRVRGDHRPDSDLDVLVGPPVFAMKRASSAHPLLDIPGPNVYVKRGGWHSIH